MASTTHTQNILNAISPSFCLAKWYQSSILLQSGLTHSCHHPSPHKIPLAELATNPEVLHNTETKKLARSQMLSGKRPLECQYCWNLEDNASMSDRSYKSAETWALPFLRQALAAGAQKNIAPKYLEVAFDHHCNFKCAYCSPQSSSRWQEESTRFGAYPTSDRYGDMEWFRAAGCLPIPLQEINPYAVAFWDWWPCLAPELHVLRITGGEPLLSQHTWRILDEIIAYPRPQLQLAINSNMSVNENLVQKLIEKVNLLQGKIAKFTLFHSMDTVGAQAEYIRYGLDFNLYTRNIEAFLSSVPEKIRVTNIITVSALSIARMRELLTWNLDLRRRYTQHSLGIDTPYLRYPAFLSLKILPAEFQSYLQDALNFLSSHLDEMAGFSVREVDRLARVLAWMQRESTEENSTGIEILHADFCKFIQEYDRRRNTHFLNIFPEYAAFFLQHKTAAHAL